VTEVRPTAEEIAELEEILLRIRAGQFDGILDSLPARLVGVTASTGKKTRATPVATAYETNRVSHVGTLPEYEQELTHWEEGMASPGRLDAGVWLVTHLSGARRARTTTSAGTTLPGTTPR
jgi:phage terminase large subunit-like protein